jgi:hypothetical protein
MLTGLGWGLLYQGLVGDEWRPLPSSHTVITNEPILIVPGLAMPNARATRLPKGNWEAMQGLLPGTNNPKGEISNREVASPNVFSQSPTFQTIKVSLTKGAAKLQGGRGA